MIDASLSNNWEYLPAGAVAHFIQQVLRSGDRLAVYAFDENVTQLAVFSDNVGHLRKRCGGCRKAGLLFMTPSISVHGLARQDPIADSDHSHTDGGETTSHADFDSARRKPCARTRFFTRL
jgi:hypothetical protein